MVKTRMENHQEALLMVQLQYMWREMRRSPWGKQDGPWNMNFTVLSIFPRNL